KKVRTGHEAMRKDYPNATWLAAIIKSSCIQFAIIMILQVHGGHFSGNNLVPMKVGETSFSQMMEELNAGAKKLCIDGDGASFTDEEIRSLVGS
ncbi:hypothetical protein PFISCL1PPCAC_23284, partial [Pristionchus fissidentatus]